MSDSAVGFWVVVFLLTLFAPASRRILGMLFGFAVRLLFLLIIIGMAWAVINSPAAYSAIGWTPVSALIGGQVYSR